MRNKGTKSDLMFKASRDNRWFTPRMGQNNTGWFHESESEKIEIKQIKKSELFTK